MALQTSTDLFKCDAKNYNHQMYARIHCQR